LAENIREKLKTFHHMIMDLPDSSYEPGAEPLHPPMHWHPDSKVRIDKDFPDLKRLRDAALLVYGTDILAWYFLSNFSTCLKSRFDI